jgi:hypothetical protein
MAHKHTCVWRKAMAVGKVLAGKSQGEVAVEFNVKQSTISRWVQRYSTEGNCEKHRGSGLTCKTTEKDNYRLVQYFQEPHRRFNSLRKAMRATNFPGYYNVAWMRREGRRRRRAAKKRLLTQDHEIAGLQWCNAWANMHPQDFHRYIWTDEKTFSTKNNGPVFCWRPKKKRYHKNFIAPKYDSGWTSIHVWCAITAEGVLEFHTTPTCFKDVDYIHLLENRVLPAAQARFSEEQLIYQHVSISIILRFYV